MEELVVIRKSELTSLIEECLRRVLNEKAEKTKKQDQLSNIIDINQVAEITGYKKNTIYRLVHERKIPFHKAVHGGRKLIFYRIEIDEWLKGKKPESSEEYCERMEAVLFNSKRK